jgi:hypothetical protein
MMIAHYPVIEVAKVAFIQSVLFYYRGWGFCGLACDINWEVCSYLY